MRLISDNQYSGYANTAIAQLENAILKDCRVELFNNKYPVIGKILWKFFKISGRKISTFFPKKNISHFTVLMGPFYYSKCLPYFLFSEHNNIYMFDAWPKYHEELEHFINLANIDNVFFSSKQVADKFQKKTEYKSIWIPEGIDPSRYHYMDYSKKDIDVIQYGRKYEWYHDKIFGPLSQNGYNYLFENKKGDVIFPDEKDFTDGLSRSKISICFPSSETHPERAGNISTLTLRYLESMASKCIILGTAPEELNTLFGYKPVIEIDRSDPYGQLSQILNSYPDYVPLIEKNYNTVCKKNTWDNRWKEMKKKLFEKD